MTTYADLQSREASEKIGLVILEAAKRLLGWTVSSGSVYQLAFQPSVIVSIEDSGVALNEVASLAAVVAGSYYHDRQGRTIYLRTSDSSHPNGRFIGATFRLFFSDAPGVRAPNDLATGFPVEWVNLLKDTSQFGVELDNQNQLGMAIEGSGSVNFYNDRDFWAPIFDKYYFENKRCLIYSWSRNLPISEAKIIYRGRVDSKSYTDAQVSFSLKDLLGELKAPISLPLLADVLGARIPDSLAQAVKRMVYGFATGFRPTNIDQVLDGYPLTGTAVVTQGSSAVTGVASSFLAQLSPDDEILFDGDEDSVTVQEITSNTALVLSSDYDGETGTKTMQIMPARAKRYTNRAWVLASHALREPSTTVVKAYNQRMFELADLRDIRVGDQIVVGSEIAEVLRISGPVVTTVGNLLLPPAPGTTVTRPAVTNVYINDRKLRLSRDYTYSAALATLTLDPLAEVNVAPIQALTGTITITSGSRLVTGAGTQFKAELRPGDWVKSPSQVDLFEILSVESDTGLTLRVAPGFSYTGDGQRKTPLIYSEDDCTLSCDLLGKTQDGTTSGILLSTAPLVVRDLVTQAGLQDELDLSSFATSGEIAYQRLGFAIPAKYADRSLPKIRDVISDVNRSVFGSLVQNEDFQLEYHVLRPKRAAAGTLRLDQADVAKFSVKSASDKIVKTARVQYLKKEYDPVSGAESITEALKTSRNSEFLAKTANEFTVATYLVDEAEAQMIANRWAFLLEMASSIVTIEPLGLQAQRLQVTDQVELSHERLYERVGSQGTRKVAAIQKILRSTRGSVLELEDLSNAFSRCSVIAASGSPAWADSGAREQSFQGFITDTYGMINNDPETYGINLIW